MCRLQGGAYPFFTAQFFYFIDAYQVTATNYMVRSDYSLDPCNNLWGKTRMWGLGNCGSGFHMLAAFWLQGVLLGISALDECNR
jgi:hypothetical protein